MRVSSIEVELILNLSYEMIEKINSFYQISEIIQKTSKINKTDEHFLAT